MKSVDGGVLAEACMWCVWCRLVAMHGARETRKRQICLEHRTRKASVRLPPNCCSSMRARHREMRGTVTLTFASFAIGCKDVQGSALVNCREVHNVALRQPTLQL